MLTRKLQDSAEGMGCTFISDLWQLLAEWIGEQPDGQQEMVLGAFYCSAGEKHKRPECSTQSSSG